MDRKRSAECGVRRPLALRLRGNGHLRKKGIVGWRPFFGDAAISRQRAMRARPQDRIAGAICSGARNAKAISVFGQIPHPNEIHPFPSWLTSYSVRLARSGFRGTG